MPSHTISARSAVTPCAVRNAFAVCAPLDLERQVAHVLFRQTDVVKNAGEKEQLFVVLQAARFADERAEQISAQRMVEEIGRRETSRAQSSTA